MCGCALAAVHRSAAQRFYTRRGFVEADRTDGRDNEERAPDVLYEYALTTPRSSR
jgi:hypothetical protein